MKKISVVLGLALVLSVGTVVGYADSGILGSGFHRGYSANLSQESIDEILKERDEFRKERLNKAVKDGTISESQVKEWEDHYRYMDEFHEKNGYLDDGYGCGSHMSNGMGHRGNNGTSHRGNNGMGHHGMMRGYSY